MKYNNMFFGGGCQAQFAKILYKRLMSRKWFTYADIMEEYLESTSESVIPGKITYGTNYPELKKTFLFLKRLMNERLGEDWLERSGNNRNMRYRYVGKDDDPLTDIRNAKVINNLRQYWKFCQDSAGFFPQSWLDYYFQDCLDLLQIKEKKKKGEQVISASLDRIHMNIAFLPFLYESIINKKVLEIDYKPYDEEQVTLLFHPHFLKEYNGRWHLFGHADGRKPENGYDLALDRIQSRPREMDKMEYIAAPPMFYINYFKDMVGVSHLENPIIDDIIVRAHSSYIYNLLKTKPLHHSQDVKNEFKEYKDGTYGDFIVHVEVNNEFIGRILQMGSGLEIMAPKEARDLFHKRVHELAILYKELDK